MCLVGAASIGSETHVFGSVAGVGVSAAAAADGLGADSLAPSALD